VILRRLQNSRFSVVQPEWKGCAAVVIGGGPSLTQEQVATVYTAHCLDNVRVIAVNDAYLWAPWADVSFFADASWWTQHHAGVAKPMLRLSAEHIRARFAAFCGQKCSIESQVGNITDDAVHILRNARTDPKGIGIHAMGLSLDPGALITGRNSGWQATNLAVLAGANPIILLGIDAQIAKDGRTHWSGGHREPTAQECYEWYKRSFHAAETELKAAGVTVINCSPHSAVDAFPKMDIAEALATCGIVAAPAEA
jgi:hypothetical protein